MFCIESLRKLNGKRRQCAYHRNTGRNTIHLRTIVLTATVFGLGIIDRSVVHMGHIHCCCHCMSGGMMSHLFAGQLHNGKRLAGKSQ